MTEEKKPKGLDELRSERRVKASALKTIATKAQSENRAFTDEEKTRVEGLMSELDDLQRKEREITKDAALLRDINNLGGETPGPTYAGGSSWKNATISAWTQGHTKALVVGAPATIITPPAWDPQIHDLGTPKRFVQSIIPTVKMDGDNSVYFRQTVRTNNAAAVDPGDAKPVSVFTVERQELKPITVAHLTEALNVNDFKDASQLGEFVESELRLGLVKEVDRETIEGDPGAATPEMNGLTNTSGIQVQPWDTDIFVTARKAITKVENVDAAASHFLLSSVDWERYELSTDANDRFYFEQAPIDRANAKLWGLPVVVSSVIPSGVGYVGAFATEARLYLREETEIVAGTINDEFQKNLFRLRAEGRWNVAWLRPSAFVEIDLLP